MPSPSCTTPAQPGSACTIVGDDEYGRFVVKAETDEVHYGDRKYPPGKMHPLTEKVLKVIKDEALPIDWL